METKKSKVKDIIEKQSSFNGSNGLIYYHKITFENGDSGQYGSKSEKCEKFKIGQEADYTIETKVNGQFTNFIIKPVQSSVFGSGAKQNKDSGIITYLSCLSSAANFYHRQQPTSWEEVLKAAEQAYSKAMEKK